MILSPAALIAVSSAGSLGGQDWPLTTASIKATSRFKARIEIVGQVVRVRMDFPGSLGR